MIRRSLRRVGTVVSTVVATVITGALLLAAAPGVGSQQGEMDVTVEAPASLGQVADRIRHIDRLPLSAALARAGLAIPPQIHVTLVRDDDPLARATPVWIVGLASGSHDIAIFPGRIGTSAAAYPYDSLESVVWHEVTHLALSAQAGDRPLPRWFQEGVAMSVEQGWGAGSQVQLLFAAWSDPGLAALRRLFDSESQPETASAYLLAEALVSDIRQRHGATTPGAIADRVARGASFADAFALETGATPRDAAEHAWRAYRRWTSWLPVITSTSSLWIGIMGLALVAFLATLRKRRRLRRQWDLEDKWRASPTPAQTADDDWASADSDPTVH